MIHGFTEQEWEAYVEGRLPAAEQDRFEAHMLGCWSCWDRYDQMKLATDQLREAGAAVRRSLQPPHTQMQTAFRQVLQRWGTPITPEQIQVRLERLEAVLAGMCGTRTATHALRHAAKQSPAQTLEHVTSDNWEPFLENLTSLAIVMCGETGAHLVRRKGQF